MARQPVAELWVDRRSGGALVRVGTGSMKRVEPDHSRGDLLRWVDQSAIPAGAMAVGGMGLATLGVLFAIVFGPSSFMMAAAVSSMVTLGGGLTFMGLLKQRRARASEEPPQETAGPITPPTVVQERARRVHRVLAESGDLTFEALSARLRWTESALLETLLFMKERGALEEDLDLDSGEWVYRVQYASHTGVPSSMMLEDRRFRSGAER